MFSWEYNKKMIEMYMTDHAQDMGRFWAQICLKMPTIYTQFMMGFMEGLSNTNKKE